MPSRAVPTIAAAWLLAAAAQPAMADVRIMSSPGGPVVPYVKLFEAVRDSGERVIIDGPCLSACTMVLGVIPKERICVTAKARLGFHAAWHPGDDGRPVTSRAATQLLMDIYPQHVRTWIKDHGGLSPKMMYLTGRELAAMYQTCQ